MTSGVPQSTVLGPLLFQLYVDDLHDLKSSLMLFADDALPYGVISNEDDREYPHKGKMFFVESNWNSLNVFPIWVYY